MDITLYPFQVESVEALRANIRAGVKNQILSAPTGSGKTVLASYLLDECYGKGRKRAVFVCDRIPLVDQTSAMLDAYKIPHGVIQADHWRYRPWERIQVASAQTLARRQWPESDLIIIDEAHGLQATVLKRIAARNCVTIGLTATPFTKGLGQHYERVVSVTTTNRLIRDGHLADYKIFAASEPDMTGAKVVAGEWEEAEAARRAMPIVGDCVAEYLKHGGEKKFIAFGCTVAHCEEMQRQFMAAGVQCALYTYRTGDDERSRMVEEFRKPNSYIRGLISVSALAKGFDVSDVEVVILARPLRKSLTEHIQMLGRGLRSHPGKESCVVLDHAGNCIATGSRVLTRRGLVPIEKILLSDRLWDGHEFVSHKGVVNRGRKHLVRYAGLAATADHLVKTAAGWRPFGECAEEQTPIVTTGLGGTAIRECDDYFTRSGLAGREREPQVARALRVRDVWLPLRRRTQQPEGRSHKGLSSVQSTAKVPHVAVCSRAGHATALHQPARERMERLRGARHPVPVHQSIGMRSLDCRGARTAGRLQGYGARQNQQRRTLRTWEPSLGPSKGQYEQYPQESLGAPNASVQDGAPGHPVCRCDTPAVPRVGVLLRGHSGEVSPAIQEAEGEVWDILDAGPRNSFTCEGLLVHNCVRFWSRMQDFFENGASELDDGRQKEKKKTKEKEKKPQKCPRCFRVHDPRPTCPHCGHVYPKRSGVSHVAGELVELGSGASATPDQRQAVYSQLLWIARERGYKPGYAAAKFKSRFGTFPNGLREVPAPPSPALLRWIRAEAIAYAKSRKR